VKRIAFYISMLLLAGCVSELPSFPPAVIPASPSANQWPDAGAAILDDTRTLEYRVSSASDRQRLIAVLVHRVRYKVLSERGLRHATMVLPVDGYSSITKVAARSVHPNGREVYLRQVDIIPRDERGRPVPVGAVGNVSLTIPQARVGGLLEFQYERVFTDPDMVPVMVLGQDVPVLRSEVALITPSNVRVDYSFGRGGKVEEPHPILVRLSDGRDRLVFVEKAMPAFHPEPSMPHLSWVAPWVAFNIASAQVEDRMYRLENWKHIGERMQFLFEATGEIAPIEGTPAQRYRALQSELKVSSRNGVGVLPPRSTVELRKGALVSGRDAAVLLQRTLKQAGLQAYPALLSSAIGPPVVDGFPSISPFARVVVAVKAKDVLEDKAECGSSALLARSPLCTVAEHGFVFVDPMCETCRFGELPSELTGGRALLVGIRSPRFIDVPTSLPETNLTVTHYEATATSVGEVSGGVSVQMIGHGASALRQIARQFSPDDDISDTVEQLLRGKRGSVVFGSGSSENVRDPSQPLILSASIVLKDVQIDYDTFSFRLGDIIGAGLPGAFRKVRHYPKILSAPARWDTTVRLTLPAGYRVKAPDPIELNWGGVRVYMACDVQTEHLTCARRVELTQQVVLPAFWAQFRTMVDKMAAMDAQRISLFRGTEASESEAGIGDGP